MENLILIFVSLGSLTRELFECLAVLVHGIHGLGIVEHEGACARHAEFDTLHSSLLFKVNKYVFCCC
jgi:hypothetical protein